MSTELIQQPVDLAANFMPVFTTETALQRYQAFKDFVKSVLKEGIDFGKNPGSDRDTLLKPGAEKLCTFFGLTPRYVLEVVVEDWRGDKYGQPLFYYRFKCQLFRGDLQMGEGIGSCSSWEAKYRYRWVDENTVTRMGLDKSTLNTRGGAISEFEFAINKAETSGQYGKPAEYWAKWKQAITDGKARKINKMKKDGTTSPAYEMDMTMYRVPNSDFADIINTVQKIAQKRAYVAATLSAANASDYFTQDLEDYIEVDAIPTGGNPVGTQAAADYVRDQKLQQQRAEQPEVAPAAAPPQPATQTPPAPEVAAAPVQTQSTPAFKGSKSVPEGLQSLWRQMFKPEGRLQVFDMFKANLIKSLGEEEGTRAFYAVLNRHNAKEPRDFNKSLSDARRAAKDMYEIVEPLLAKQAAA
jgi:hypothetical protein